MSKIPGSEQDAETNETSPNDLHGGPQARPPRQWFLYGLAIFSSAFLLFALQPLIAKIILPWFGGAAAVWTVCLLFFEVVLLLGYSYAHLLAQRARPASQGRIHAALLLASLLALPILPKDSWKPADGGEPVLQILTLLTLTIGLPYFLLSSTSPLLQAWYARSRESTMPYRLYALSNIGSLLALLGYPLLVEPHLSSPQQARAWSALYAGFAALTVLVAISSVRDATSAEKTNGRRSDSDAPDAKMKILWVSLAACGSALLLAVTNHITQNIASVPLLWMIPLSLYLLSFILCFDNHRWYPRGLFLRLLGIALGGMTYALAPSFSGLPIKILIPLYCFGLFVCCMFCHGELARMKPGPDHATTFYLMLSLGGAIGAIFVALLAPHIFSGYYELHVAMGICAALVLVVHRRDLDNEGDGDRWQPSWLILAALTLAIIASLAVNAHEESAGARLSARNFYGVLRVVDESAQDELSPQEMPKQQPVTAPPGAEFRVLMNGTIKHGIEFLAAGRRDRPTSYYGPSSGIGAAIQSAQKRGSLRMGAIGLGAGTIAAYGQPGDRYTFYEINPLDVQIARTQFSFLRDSRAKIDIVLGDARISLAREEPQGFDILAVDAFSGDSIPTHLLTREAFELYFHHVKPEGIVAVHISNKYLNLEPVVRGAAVLLDKKAVVVSNADDHPEGIYAATWILLGSPEAFADQPQLVEAGIDLPPGRSDIVPWTDTYSSLLPLLK